MSSRGSQQNTEGGLEIMPFASRSPRADKLTKNDQTTNTLAIAERLIFACNARDSEADDVPSHATQNVWYSSCHGTSLPNSCDAGVPRLVGTYDTRRVPVPTFLQSERYPYPYPTGILINISSPPRFSPGGGFLAKNIGMALEPTTALIAFGGLDNSLGI